MKRFVLAAALLALLPLTAEAGLFGRCKKGSCSAPAAQSCQPCGVAACGPCQPAPAAGATYYAPPTVYGAPAYYGAYPAFGSYPSYYGNCPGGKCPLPTR